MCGKWIYSKLPTSIRQFDIFKFVNIKKFEKIELVLKIGFPIKIVDKFLKIKKVKLSFMQRETGVKSIFKKKVESHIQSGCTE